MNNDTEYQDTSDETVAHIRGLLAKIREMCELAEQADQLHGEHPELVTASDARAIKRRILDGRPAARKQGRAAFSRIHNRLIRLEQRARSKESAHRPRASTRPRAQRSPRRGSVKTTQDPGSDDGGDPDPDPVGEAIKRLLDSAPPFSVGQRALLGRLLGGVQ
jgi:hypothetical protein